jgi:8-oxo-dGTP pyrophosphatase MutT (NUDIX family)
MTSFDYSRLPRKRMATGALLLDAESRVLIVRPTYREAWLVPGGIVEEHESPRAACVREVREEIGLEIVPGRLLCVEYRSPVGERTECVHFIFSGGTLRRDEIESIRLSDRELVEHAFVPTDAAREMLTAGLARRIDLAMRALREGCTVYSEDGRE